MCRGAGRAGVAGGGQRSTGGNEGGAGREEQPAPGVLSDASEKQALKTRDFTEGEEGKKREKNS